MPGPYDDNVKKLVDANPQDFVLLVLGRGQFEFALPHELKSVHLHADALFRVLLDGILMLLHIEFQSGYDPIMQERLLEYNTLASREHGYLPVCSCVIHLKKDSSIPKSPFIRKLPTGEEIVRFHYKSIELWNMSSDELLQTGLVGLLPLVPLTQGGTQQEVVEEMFAELKSAGKTELLVIASAIASLAFEDTSPAKQKWLERTLAMLNDIIRNTRYYQGILKEGREEGREEGLEEGLEKGREEVFRQELQRQREALLDIVIKRFPKIVRSVRKQIEAIDDSAILWHLIVEMSAVQTDEEARELLLTLGGDEEQK